MTKNNYRTTGSLIALFIAEIGIWVLLLLWYSLCQSIYNSFQFGNEAGLWLFPLTTLSAVVYWVVIYSRKKRLEKFAANRMLGFIVPQISTFWSFLHFLFFRLGLTLVAIAIAQPQYGIKQVEAKSEGIDLVIALDVSLSMNAEDLKPSRLERAALSIESLLKELAGDRVAIVTFAGDANVLVPLTTDYKAIKSFLTSINTGYQMQGTAISDAIDVSMMCFDMDKATNKAIIVISDGEDHEDDAVGAAKMAKEKDVIVHTIGLGSASGAQIPLYNGDQQNGFKTDKSGNVVVTKLNESLMKEVAAAGGGEYIRGKDASFGLGAILTEINEMEAQSNVTSKKFLDYEDHFYVYLILGALFLIIEAFLPERNSKKTVEV